VDDAYITFRYARNIVNGIGFVYNPAERVMGTTTPLYTLLMAGLSFLLRTSNYPPMAIWINALTDGATCALLVSLGQAISGHRRVGIAAGLLYTIAPFSVTFAIGGMETSVFVLLLCLTALLYLRGATFWPFTAALALLTRPDALIFVGPIGLHYLFRYFRSLSNRSYSLRIMNYELIKSATLFFAPLLPWVLFATFYFGSPIPHSIAAKTAAYRLSPEEGFIRLWQHYSTPFFEDVTIQKSPLNAIKIPVGETGIPFGNFWPLPGIILYLSLSIIGLLTSRRHDSCTLPITLYPFLYFVTFAIANPLIFRWYLTPPLPLYFILILTGLTHIIDSIVQRILRFIPSPTHPYAQTVFILTCAFFFLLTIRAWVLIPDHGPARPAPDMAWFQLEELYTQVSRQLAPEVTPDTVIAAGDIGAIGYFSGARILDTLGLVSPESTAYYPLPADQLVINYAISADLIVDLKPDYVVFLEVYGRRTLLNDPRFLSDYTLREKTPTDIYGSDGMMIYGRNR
jgi:hypothetical protein